MKNDNIKRLVWAGLFTALTTVATMIIRIPVGTGYWNVGDALVILSAYLLGPAWGAVAAGLGSALADVLSGYIMYAPGTIIIKALMALVAALILKTAKNKKTYVPGIIGSILAELIMVAGYFLYEAFILGYGAGAIANVYSNALQGLVGAAAGTVLFYALLRIPYVKKTF